MQELEQAMLELSNLSHVGIALLQFARGLQTTMALQKGPDGIYHLGWVGFSLPTGGDAIWLHFGADIQAYISQSSVCLKWLDLCGEGSSQMYEIIHARQMGCATHYIEAAYEQHLTTMKISPYDPSAN